MEKLNVNCDFKIIESSQSYDVTTPFTYVYRVGAVPYEVSFDGKKYTNCKRLNDGSLLVTFNSHHFGCGKIIVERSYFLQDEDYADGICRVVTKEELGIMLVDGETEAVDTPRVILGKYYTTIPDKNFAIIHTELPESIQVGANVVANEVYNVGEVANITIEAVDVIPYSVVILFKSGETATTLNLPSGTKYIGETIEIEPNAEYKLTVELGVVLLDKLSVTA